ncbi:MAG: hypothetical protein HFH70_10430 [Lachnospiraceae bacterium]|nr:hypothetical protein [Lachnospiraceae bacterium]
MDKMTKKIIGAFVAIIVVAAAVTGIYFAMNRQAEKKAQEEEALPSSEVGKLLAKDLELKYPETPTEVLKLYWRLNRCMYNEGGISDSDFEGLLKQLRLLYDEELLAQDKNSFEEMLKNFKDDKEKAGRAISSVCIVQTNDTVNVVELDGKECATIITFCLIRENDVRKQVYEKFMCRRDSQNKWKILGWQLTNADEAAKVGVTYKKEKKK